MHGLQEESVQALEVTMQAPTRKAAVEWGASKGATESSKQPQAAIAESKQGRLCYRKVEAIKRVGAGLASGQKVLVLDARYTIVELIVDFL